MAKYTSNYLELGFVVNGVLKRFDNGQYTTNNKAEEAVLDELRDATKVEQQKPAAKPKATAKTKEA